MKSKYFKECMAPHTMLHSLFGFGLGVLAASVLGLTGSMGVILGLLGMIVAFVGDFMMSQKK